MVENFLSATLDAQMVAEEVDLQEEVDNIPPPILVSILAKYLGVQEDKIGPKQDVNEKEASKKNLEPMHNFDSDSVLLKAKGPSSCVMKDTIKTEPVIDDEKTLEEIPFVEVNKGFCIKLEPP